MNNIARAAVFVLYILALRALAHGEERDAIYYLAYALMALFIATAAESRHKN